MTKQAIIKRTINAINKLPEDKAEEISNFADFIIHKYEENMLIEGMQHLVSDSESFNFLKEDEDLYTTDDLKIKYND